MKFEYYEEIKNFIGTKYIDNNTMNQDMLDKPIMMKVFNDLSKDNKISKISYLSFFHIINELDRNVRNHSGIYDKDNEYYKLIIEIEESIFSLSIHDNGFGISDKLHGVNQYEKITNSLHEGVTTKSNWEMASIQNKNSGYGLFALFGCTSNKLFSGKIISKGTLVYFAGEDTFVKPHNVKGDYFMNVYFQGDINRLPGIINKVQKKSNNKSTKSVIKSIDADAFYKYMMGIQSGNTNE